jgi:hypothetical protein
MSKINGFFRPATTNRTIAEGTTVEVGERVRRYALTVEGKLSILKGDSGYSAKQLRAYRTDKNAEGQKVLTPLSRHLGVPKTAIMARITGYVTAPKAEYPAPATQEGFVNVLIGVNAVSFYDEGEAVPVHDQTGKFKSIWTWFAFSKEVVADFLKSEHGGFDLTQPGVKVKLYHVGDSNIAGVTEFRAPTSVDRKPSMSASPAKVKPEGEVAKPEKMTGNDWKALGSYLSESAKNGYNW